MIKVSEWLFAMTMTLMVPVVAGLLMTGCQATDDLAPVMTLIGADTIFHVLNEEYDDPGVSAIDDTDGDITSKVFVDNQVDIDRMGEYSVNYRVVDEAGNEAAPVSRLVVVYNQGVDFIGDYFSADYEVYPGQDTCAFPNFVWVDSTLNWRLVFLDFACNSQRQVFADVLDSVIIIPYQEIQDSLINMVLQGSGSITDTLILIEYTRTEEAVTSYWKSHFTRLE